MAVAAEGLRNGWFPFRPRRTGTSPSGDPHRLDRSEEPFLYWYEAGGLLGVGGLALAVAVVLGIGLLIGRR